jgi:putative SOS response-associated peptidase YedK
MHQNLIETELAALHQRKLSLLEADIPPESSFEKWLDEFVSVVDGTNKLAALHQRKLLLLEADIPPESSFEEWLNEFVSVVDETNKLKKELLEVK